MSRPTRKDLVWALRTIAKYVHIGNHINVFSEEGQRLGDILDALNDEDGDDED